MLRYLLPIDIAAAMKVLSAQADESAFEDRVLNLPKDYRESYTLYFTGDRLFEDEQTVRI